MGLRADRRRTRHKRDEARRDKRDTRRGSDRRAKLVRLIAFFVERIKTLTRRIRRREEEREAAPDVDWRGHQPVLGDKGKTLVKKAAEYGLVVTSTTGGAHSPTSFHYQNRAIDFGVESSLVGTAEATKRLVAFQRKLAGSPAGLAELFGPDNSANVKYGARVTLSEGSALEDQHDNHVHVAI